MWILLKKKWFFFTSGNEVRLKQKGHWRYDRAHDKFQIHAQPLDCQICIGIGSTIHIAHTKLKTEMHLHSAITFSLSFVYSMYLSVIETYVLGQYCWPHLHLYIEIFSTLKQHLNLKRKQKTTNTHGYNDGRETKNDKQQPQQKLIN